MTVALCYLLYLINLVYNFLCYYTFDHFDHCVSLIFVMKQVYEKGRYNMDDSTT